MLGFDIEWRGKRLGGKKGGEWIFGSLYDDGGELYILPPQPGSAIDYEDYQIDPNTLGLWIGKRDKYGLPIFTDDLLQDKYGRKYKVEMMQNLIQVAVKDEVGIKKDPRTFKFNECIILGTKYD